jgi:threonine dehydrogenase-like Zn-dependent dehydrogenase
MQATVLYGPRDIRFEERPEPAIVEPTDAIISLPVTCICGSDLWPYRGIAPFPAATAMGHEYCGYVEEVARRARCGRHPEHARTLRRDGDRLVRG